MDAVAALPRDAEMDEHEALLEFVYVCPHGLVEFDRDGAVLMMNPACARLLLPVMAADARGTGLGNLLDALAPFAPDLRNRLESFREASGLIMDGMHIHVGQRPASGLPRAGGRMRAGESTPLVLTLTLLRLTRDRHMAVLADVSEQVAQQRRLGEVEAWFSALADGADDYAFFGLDSDGRVNDWNNAARRLFGREARDAIGMDGDALLCAAGEPAMLARRLPHVRHEGWQVVEGWMAGPDGSRFWGTSVISAMRAAEDGSAPSAFLAVVRDTTERREAAQALRHALCQDHLTGLLNRRRFFELGEAECRRAQQGHRGLSAIMVDIDHFKSINDIYGHGAGDTALTAVAGLLRLLTRDEVDLVGRLGGEEFALLLPGRDAAAATAVAERLRGALEVLDVLVKARNGAKLTLRVTASFGVAEQRQSDSGLEALLATADAALYAAKAGGRNCVRLSQPEIA